MDWQLVFDLNGPYREITGTDPDLWLLSGYWNPTLVKLPGQNWQIKTWVCADMKLVLEFIFAWFYWLKK